MRIDRGVVAITAVAFSIGVLLPVLISMMFVLVSWQVATFLFTILVPLSIMDMNEILLIGLNGCLYALVGLAYCAIFRR